MTDLRTEPIPNHWIEVQPPAVEGRSATAADVTRHLALIGVNDIDLTLLPLLAAAAAELAPMAGITWPSGGDDPPIALVRLITKVAVRNPNAGGRHTARLLDRLP